MAVESAAGRKRAALESLPRVTSALVHGDLGRADVLWETVGGVHRLDGVVDRGEGELADGLRGYRSLP